MSQLQLLPLDTLGVPENVGAIGEGGDPVDVECHKTKTEESYKLLRLMGKKYLRGLCCYVHVLRVCVYEGEGWEERESVSCIITDTMSAELCSTNNIPLHRDVTMSSRHHDVITCHHDVITCDHDVTKMSPS